MSRSLCMHWPRDPSKFEGWMGWVLLQRIIFMYIIIVLFNFVFAFKGLNSFPSVRIYRYIPSYSMRKVCSRSSEKKIPKRVGAACFTALWISKTTDTFPSYCTVFHILLWKDSIRLFYFGGNSVLIRTFNKMLLLTKSNAFVRLLNKNGIQWHILLSEFFLQLNGVNKLALLYTDIHVLQVVVVERV